MSGARCQGITVVLFTWPMLSALAGTRDPFTAFLLMMGGLLIVGGYAIANSLFGGTVSVIGAALQKSDPVDLFFTYVTVAIGISLLVYIFALKNRKATYLDREQGNAWSSAPAAAKRTDDDDDFVNA